MFTYSEIYVLGFIANPWEWFSNSSALSLSVCLKMMSALDLANLAIFLLKSQFGCWI